MRVFQVPDFPVGLAFGMAGFHPIASDQLPSGSGVAAGSRQNGRLLLTGLLRPAARIPAANGSLGAMREWSAGPERDWGNTLGTPTGSTIYKRRDLQHNVRKSMRDPCRMSDTIYIPVGAHDLRSNHRGFEVLANLAKSLSAHSGQRLAIDCSKLGWIDGHLAAPLLTVIAHARRNGNQVALANIPNNVGLILRKNGFLKDKAIDSYQTTIPVQSFALDDEVDFANYTRKHLKRKEMPKIGPALIGKIFEGIDEIFANCALHSYSPVKVVATGQFFPRKEIIAFAISDGGRGIEGSLRAARIPFESPESAIDWAMQSNNTSRQGDIPGGLGLNLLREFIRLNKGRLVVASNAGVWQQDGSEVYKSRLTTPYPGTSVILEIRTDDKKVYDLKSSHDPRNIW